MELSRRYLTRKLSITEIGGALGGVGISAISQNKRRLEVKRKKDEKLEKKFKNRVILEQTMIILTPSSVLSIVEV